MDEPKFLSEEFIDRFPFVARSIFRHLDVVDLNRCRLVSKKWKATIESDPYFWDACFKIIKDGLFRLSVSQRFTQTDDSIITTAQEWCDIYEEFSKTSETFVEMVNYVVFLQHYFHYGLQFSFDSPLNFAARIGCMFIIELCMERNFNFNKPDLNAPIHCACIHGQLEVVKYIFEHSESHGIDLNAIGDYETPLRHSAYAEDADVFNYILDSAKEKGIPICFRSKGGYNVVRRMSDACFKVLMERAIEVGFDINAIVFHGSKRTLQHWDYGEEDTHSQTRWYRHNISGVEFRQSLFEYRDKSGLDLNAKDAWGRTPISWACACNKPNILETYLKLIEKGVTLDFDARDNIGQTVLHFACWQKNPVMLKLLLKYAGNQLSFDIKDNNGLTPLHYASFNWPNFELIWIAHDLGVIPIMNLTLDRNMMTEKNLLLTSMLLSTKDLEKCLHLFHEKGELQGLLDARNFCEETIVHQAVSMSKLSGKVLGYPLSPYRVDDNLHHDETLGVLGEFCQSHGYKIDWNASDELGRTPFHVACSEQYLADHYYAVKFFLKASKKVFIDLNATDEDRRTAFFLAGLHEARFAKTFQSEYSVVDLLLENSIEYGIHLNLQDDFGETLLHQLTQHGKKGRHVVLEKVLLASKNTNLDVNAPRSHDNRTPFHMACFYGYPEVVKLFLDNAAELKICLNPRDDNGLTPLHLACKNESNNKFQFQLRTIRLILNSAKKLGIDVEAEDRNGKTAYSYAKFNGFHRLLSL